MVRGTRQQHHCEPLKRTHDSIFVRCSRPRCSLLHCSPYRHLCWLPVDLRLSPVRQPAAEAAVWLPPTRPAAAGCCLPACCWRCISNRTLPCAAAAAAAAVAARPSLEVYQQPDDALCGCSCCCSYCCCSCSCCCCWPHRAVVDAERLHDSIQQGAVVVSTQQPQVTGCVVQQQQRQGTSGRQEQAGRQQAG